MDSIVQQISKQINLNYSTNQLLAQDSSFEKAYFNKRKQNKTVLTICELLFWLSLSNNRSQWEYDNLPNQTEYINERLHHHFINELTEDELIQLCSIGNRIHISDVDSIIPFLYAQLYYYTILNTMNNYRLDIKEIESELDYIVKHISSITSLIVYYKHIFRQLGINNFDLNVITNINTTSNHVKTKIPLYFTTRQNKKYICSIFNFSEQRTITSDNISSIDKTNIFLHSLARTEYIDNPDECKLIALDLYKNQLIKFTYDPIITQIEFI